MFYKVLGMVVWNGGKFVLRRRNGSTYAPKSVVAGVGLAVVAALVGAALMAVRRGSS